MKIDRRSGIGGSDIAWVSGLVDKDHPYYKTAYEVYEEKVNGVSRDLSGNEAVKWGNALENPIANVYEEMIGKPLFSSDTFKHKKYPFLIGTPDRIIPTERKGIEIKTCGYRSRHLWGESGSQEVPDSYYMQIAHYMLVLDYDSWDICVLIGGQELRTYSFQRDKEIDEIIIESGTKFWKDNVLKKVPPPIDYSNPNIQNLIRKKYKLVSEGCVSLDDKFIEVANKIEDADEKIKTYTKIKNEGKSIILDAMGFAGKALLSDGRSFERIQVSRKGYTVEDSTYVKFKSIRR